MISYCSYLFFCFYDILDDDLGWFLLCCELTCDDDKGEWLIDMIFIKNFNDLFYFNTPNLLWVYLLIYLLNFK